MAVDHGSVMFLPRAPSFKRYSAGETVGTKFQATLQSISGTTVDRLALKTAHLGAARGVSQGRPAHFLGLEINEPVQLHPRAVIKSPNDHQTIDQPDNNIAEHQFDPCRSVPLSLPGGNSSISCALQILSPV